MTAQHRLRTLAGLPGLIPPHEVAQRHTQAQHDNGIFGHERRTDKLYGSGSMAIERDKATIDTGDGTGDGTTGRTSHLAFSSPASASTTALQHAHRYTEAGQHQPNAMAQKSPHRTDHRRKFRRGSRGLSLTSATTTFANLWPVVATYLKNWFNETASAFAFGQTAEGHAGA